MVAQAVVDGPHPLNYYVTDAMLNVMQNGFSAMRPTLNISKIVGYVDRMGSKSARDGFYAM